MKYKYYDTTNDDITQPKWLNQQHKHKEGNHETYTRKNGWLTKQIGTNQKKIRNQN